MFALIIDYTNIMHFFNCQAEKLFLFPIFNYIYFEMTNFFRYICICVIITQF